jgi:hypothetical protein
MLGAVAVDSMDGALGCVVEVTLTCCVLAGGFDDGAGGGVGGGASAREETQGA